MIHLTENQLKHAISRYDLGHPLKDIAKDLEVSRGTLTKRLRAAGIEIRKRGRRKATGKMNNQEPINQGAVNVNS